MLKSRLLTVSLLVISFFPMLGQETIAQGIREGQVNWIEGYISAVREGTTSPSGNKIKDQLRAVRAATILAQRALLETVKELKIDSQTRVQNKMIQEEVINTRIEGTIQGAEIVKQNIRWEGDIPIATVEMRVCLNGIGVCKSEKSVVNALNLNQKDEPAHVPQQRLNNIILSQEKVIPNTQDITYDKHKPVTGLIFNLQGLLFERVILPVVITLGEGNKPLTVYSVKSVEPQIIRTYGVVRYTDSVEQAKQIPYLGDNAMIIPVSQITGENMIVIAFNAARLILETTRHGNDYLKDAKVIIAAK